MLLALKSTEDMQNEVARYKSQNELLEAKLQEQLKKNSEYDLLATQLQQTHSHEKRLRVFYFFKKLFLFKPRFYIFCNFKV